MQIQKYIAVGAGLLLAGCAGTTSMVVNPASHVPQYQAAYVVVHGGNSGDMDSALTAALMKERLHVKSGKKPPSAPARQYVVTYSDDWSWDIAMYLEEVSVSVRDGQSRNIIAHGSWENSFMHSFPDVDEVVGDLVHKLFQGFGTKSGMSVSQAGSMP